MKLDEFKAWFEGYTESMEGAPTAKQWKRIKEQVAAIDGVAITHSTYPVYIDRYVRPIYPQWTYLGAGNVSSAQGIGISNNVATTVAASAQCFNGPAAMYAAGKAEALQ